VTLELEKSNHTLTSTKSLCRNNFTHREYIYFLIITHRDIEHVKFMLGIMLSLVESQSGETFFAKSTFYISNKIKGNSP
jgi:hypothetical protein